LLDRGGGIYNDKKKGGNADPAQTLQKAQFSAGKKKKKVAKKGTT